MRFRFPVVIIDEDFRSETPRAGIRCREHRKRRHGSWGHQLRRLTSFPSNSARLGICAVDRPRRNSRHCRGSADGVQKLRAFVEEWFPTPRSDFLTAKPSLLPISATHPRELNSSSTCGRYADSLPLCLREARAYLDSRCGRFSARLHYASDGSLLLALSRHSAALRF